MNDKFEPLPDSVETLRNWKEPQLECHGPSDEEILTSFDTPEGAKFAKDFNKVMDRTISLIKKHSI